jgi:hypothetical protein
MDREQLAELLSNVTGRRVSPDEAKKIMGDVEENLQKLKKCIPPHEFVLLPTDPGRSWDKMYRCAKCQGTIKRADYYWYEKGLIHGGMKR